MPGSRDAEPPRPASFPPRDWVRLVVLELPGDGSDLGRFTSLASIPPSTAANPGPTRKLIVAYRDATHTTARFASCSAAGSCAGWTATAIEDPASGDYGADTVLTADPATGYPRLAYVDRTNGVLRVLASDGSASFSPIAELPTSAAPGASIAFGAGTWIAHGSGGVKVFGGPWPPEPGPRSAAPPDHGDHPRREREPRARPAEHVVERIAELGAPLLGLLSRSTRPWGRLPR